MSESCGAAIEICSSLVGPPILNLCDHFSACRLTFVSPFFTQLQITSLLRHGQIALNAYCARFKTTAITLTSARLISFCHK